MFFFSKMAPMKYKHPHMWIVFFIISELFTLICHNPDSPPCLDAFFVAPGPSWAKSHLCGNGVAVCQAVQVDFGVEQQGTTGWWQLHSLEIGGWEPKRLDLPMTRWTPALIFIWVLVSNIIFSSRSLGKWSNLTIIFFKWVETTN